MGTLWTSKGDMGCFQHRGLAGRQWEMGFWDSLSYTSDRSFVSLLGLE